MEEYGFGFPLLVGGMKWIKYNLENKYQPNSLSKSLMFVSEDNMKVFVEKITEENKGLVSDYWLLCIDDNGNKIHKKKYSGATCPGKLIRSYWRHLCYINKREPEGVDLNVPSIDEF